MLVDIATRVHRGESVSVDMGYVNVIWQGDANRIALECLPKTAAPPFVVNVTGAETLSGSRGGRVVREAIWDAGAFHWSGAADALLSNTTRMRSTFAPPEVTTEQMMSWVADWIERGGALLGKPTKFEARDGNF